ncbi:MAG: hypothetical protein ACJ78Q_13675 [Chloroflexia bacterium]
MADTPLESLPGWSKDQIESMKKAWITSAEQVVAIGATSRGIKSLAEQLGVSEREAESLVEQARAALTPAVRAEMEEPVDTSEFGLGARRPPAEDQDP